MEKVSVILPVFNRAHCVGRAIESVLAQNLPDWELCVGDDASTDGTSERIQEIVPGAKIARLPENRGAAAARNAALRQATGKVFAFLDSDDEWMAGKLALQLEAMRSEPELLVCATGHVLVRRDGSKCEVPGWQSDDWKLSLQTAQSFHGASTPVVRREVIESVGLQDESLRVLEDWDWMLRIAQAGGIRVLPECLAVIHENRPSDPDSTLRSTDHFLAKHAEWLRGYGEAHYRRVVSQHRENAARNLFLHGRPREGFRQLLTSVRAAPFRNGKAMAGLVPAAVDALLGTGMTRQLLTR